ncbi:molecular chaperone TorD family protein [Anaeromyxobacter terrae]|uniref:molecular chaperone TorD family protein n=1 Tax=Anaeromyxobacter terrae TaxID=2925406 RepID=UPI001F587647|nr:molecular chaperone TorD family protein [Anaeromyxobacter sp. SG22]
MTGPALSREAARAFAELLSYPDDALPGRLRAHAGRLPGGVGAALDALADRLALLGPGGAEELYTATFDLRPAVSPYAGVHLCGEGPRRNALLAHLASLRAAAGLARASEVPDHFAELLRYVAEAPEGGEAEDVAALVLAPAARRAADALPHDHPYRAALEALVAALPAPAGPPVAPQEAGP